MINESINEDGLIMVFMGFFSWTHEVIDINMTIHINNGSIINVDSLNKWSIPNGVVKMASLETVDEFPVHVFLGLLLRMAFWHVHEQSMSDNRTQASSRFMLEFRAEF